MNNITINDFVSNMNLIIKTKNPLTNIDLIKNTNSDYINYLCGRKNLYIDDEVSVLYNDLNYVNKIRYAWAVQFERYEEMGYRLYHLTTTYKETEKRSYSISDVFKFFENMYMRYFIKLLVGSHYNKPTKKAMQPFVIAFIDEHECLDRAHCFADRFASRYHVHAMIAAHPNTCTKLDSLLGENKLDYSNRWCRNIMTCCLKKAEPMRVLYASKMLYKHSDYKLYGATMN